MSRSFRKRIAIGGAVLVAVLFLACLSWFDLRHGWTEGPGSTSGPFASAQKRVPHTKGPQNVRIPRANADDVHVWQARGQRPTGRAERHRAQERNDFRYQISGTGRPGVLTHSYSFGTNPCTPCLSSPKKACVDLKNQNQCNTVAGTNCDCDFPEWARLDLDYSENPGTFRNGGPQPGTEDPAAAQRRRATAIGKDLVILPDSRPVPEESESARRDRIASRIKRFEAAGRRKGVDFDVSDDGLHVYARD